jgi:GTP-binding protein HflX
LVGYTNAGKSTLFNRLTNAHVQTADQFFATLDPTLRQLSQTDSNPIVMADTVGFISQLPHELIAAFRATLQESCEASLLLHVVDLNDPYHPIYREQVYQVLSAIGASHIPFIEVFNKIDCTSVAPQVEKDDIGNIKAVWVSAHTGAGLDLLREAIMNRVYGEMVHRWACLPPEAGRLRARLFSLGAVVAERLTGQGEWLLELRLSATTLERLYQQEGLQREWIGSKACEGLLQ